MGWKTLDDMDLDGKVVLTRVDINVPVEAGRVTDTTRIERIRPTIDDILAAGGKPVLLAHFGRPKGQPNPDMSLRIVQPALEKVLGRDVTFVDRPDRAAIDAAPGVVLVENTPLFPDGGRQRPPDGAGPGRARRCLIATMPFRRPTAPMPAPKAWRICCQSCAGRLMAEELGALDKALGSPARPVVAVVGGAKVSTKLDLLSNLIEKVDMLVIGGGMATPFLAAQGMDVGKSLCEHDLAETARENPGQGRDHRLPDPAAHGCHRRPRIQGRRGQRNRRRRCLAPPMP